MAQLHNIHGEMWMKYLLMEILKSNLAGVFNLSSLMSCIVIAYMFSICYICIRCPSSSTCSSSCIVVYSLYVRPAAYVSFYFSAFCLCGFVCLPVWLLIVPFGFVVFVTHTVFDLVIFEFLTFVLFTLLMSISSVLHLYSLRPSTCRSTCVFASICLLVFEWLHVGLSQLRSLCLSIFVSITASRLLSVLFEFAITHGVF